MAQRRARIDTELKDLTTLLWLFPAMTVAMAGTAFLMRDKGLPGVVTLLFAAGVNLGMTVYLARRAGRDCCASAPNSRSHRDAARAIR